MGFSADHTDSVPLMSIPVRFVPVPCIVFRCVLSSGVYCLQVCIAFRCLPWAAPRYEYVGYTVGKGGGAALEKR